MGCKAGLSKIQIGLAFLFYVLGRRGGKTKLNISLHRDDILPDILPLFRTFFLFSSFFVMKDSLQQANYAPITIVMCEFGNVVERGFKSQGLIASFWNVHSGTIWFC